jgi:hypothetical protein
MMDVPSMKRDLDFKDDIRDSITSVGSNIMRDSKPPKQQLSAKKSIQ